MANFEGLSDEEDAAVKDILKKYFSAEDWNALPEPMKMRHLNMTRNYVSVPTGENFMPVPEFMKRGEKKKFGKKQKEKSDEYKPKTIGAKREITNDENNNRYPKRKISQKNYIEEREPSEDRYVFCDNCNEEYLDFCTKCGMLVLLEDNPVPIGTEDRAKKTAPKGVLEVRYSPIHGVGVFAMKNLSKDIRMGPYQGNVSKINSTKGYSWKLRNGHLVNAGDETNSNYLRYVNCARNVTEQNLVAFQYRGNLYYRTCKNIEKGEELLVYYGTSFAKNLGIDTKKYFEPDTENIEMDYYTCRFCHIGLSTRYFRDSHQRYCRFQPSRLRIYEGEGYKCKYCQCSLNSIDNQQRHEKNCSRRLNKDKINTVTIHANEVVKKFECTYCDYKSKRKFNLKLHIIAIHEKEKAQLFHCDQCDFKTCWNPNLRMHLRRHAASHYFKCQACHKRFNSKVELDSHILNNHYSNISTITSKIHTCSACDYKTVIKSHFTSHYQRQHSKENIQWYHCSQCDYRTFTKQCLKSHLLIHLNKKPYICIECRHGFNQKLQLDSHILNRHKFNETVMRTISNKIHQCNFCRYQCIITTQLKAHIKTHKKDIDKLN